MSDFTETSITDAVLARMALTPDPRTHEIMRSLVTHLHDFVRDVRPTMAEWMGAIQFLTRTGHTCTGTRQEFILLSDALGVSMLVDVINHGRPDVTESTVLGPFYVPDQPVLPANADISANQPGQPLYVSGVVTSGGAPVANALVETWQSDEDGFYDVQRTDLTGSALRGSFRTDAAGAFSFWTIQPHFYPIPADGPVGDMLKATKRHPYRPAHVHFKISAPGHHPLVTHVFAPGDPYLESDAVFAVKQALVGKFPEHPPGTAPDGRQLDRPWRTLRYDFALARA